MLHRMRTINESVTAIKELDDQSAVTATASGRFAKTARYTVSSLGKRFW